MNRQPTHTWIIAAFMTAWIAGCAKQEKPAPETSKAAPQTPAEKPDESKPAPAEMPAPEKDSADKPAAAAESADPAPPDGKANDFGPFSMVVPADWRAQPPSSRMRIGQWVIPKLEGDPADGTMVLFHFPGSGGSVQMNIDRWCDQFTQPDGKNSKNVAEIRSDQIGGFKVSSLSLTGTYQDRPMPGAPEMTERPDWQLLGAIIETPNGPYFFKTTGPKNTLMAAKPKFDQFVRSIKGK